jgi:ABC-type transport system substrate-binding protein
VTRIIAQYLCTKVSKFVVVYLLIFGIVCGYDISAASDFGISQMRVGTNVEPVKIVLADSGVKPYLFEAPIQALNTFSAAVYGQLLKVNKSYKIEPSILDSWDWDFKKKYYKLHINKNAKFHNGRKVNAQDIEFSLVRGLLTSRRSFFANMLDNILGVSELNPKVNYRPGLVEGIRVLDDETLAIIPSKPNPSFLHILECPCFGPVPKEALKDDLVTWKLFPIGAGPYAVSAIDEKSSKISLTLHNIALKNAPFALELATENMFESPDVVLATASNPKPDLLIKQKLDIANRVTAIFFNFKSDLGSNLEFRKALSYAINRSEITHGYEDFNSINELLPTHFWGRADSKENYNTQKSITILDTMSKNHSFKKIKASVFNSGTPGEPDGIYLDRLKSQLSRVGIEIEIFKSKDKFLDKNDTSTVLRIFSLGSDVIDPLAQFAVFRRGSPFDSFFPAENPQYELLYDSASKAPSFDVKVESVRKLSAFANEIVLTVPLFERQATYWINPKRIRSIGNQTGGLTFLPELLEMVSPSK